MKQLYCTLLLAVALLGALAPAKAQGIYPVTASTQIVPPYSVYLPDYAVPGSDKLRVILVQNDLSQPSYQVRLRMRVEQNGKLIMQTASWFNPQPLTLSAGVPTIISGTELAAYLDAGNIEFVGGYSKDSYLRTKALPEGAYRICFTAFDYRRSDNVQVSNEGCNIFFFQKSDPPLLNTPVCNSRVTLLNPQMISFTWSSRNTPNPTPGAGTEYNFELFEVRPAGSNPAFITTTAKPIYTTTTDVPVLIYGPGEPLLQDSMQYVWRVQARDKDGRDLFSNNGYSTPCTFTYAGIDPFTTYNITKPLLQAEATGERTGHLFWPQATTGNGYAVESYRLQYRAKSDDGKNTYDWFTEELKDSAYYLYSLEPDHTYEARLQWKVSGVYGPYSDIASFHTNPARVYQCGEAGAPDAPGSAQPLNTLVAGMMVKVGQFDMQVLQAKGGNGVFSGYGSVTTPMLGFSLGVQFTNIHIDANAVMTSGEVVALTNGMPVPAKDTTRKPQQPGTSGSVDSTITFAYLLQELTELDITDNLGDIQDIINEVKAADSTLPADLKDRLENATAIMVQAKQDYDAASAVYNNSAASDEDKQAAKQKMNNAQSAFLQARQDVAGVQQQANALQGQTNADISPIRDSIYTGLIDDNIAYLEALTSDYNDNQDNQNGPYFNELYSFDHIPCWDNYTAQQKAQVLQFLKTHRSDNNQFKKLKQEIENIVSLDAQLRDSIGVLEKYVNDYRRNNPGSAKTAIELLKDYNSYKAYKADQFCGVLWRLWQRSLVSAKFADEHAPVTGKMSSATVAAISGDNIGKWLAQHNISGQVYLHKVGEAMASTGAGNASLALDDAMREFDNGAFKKNIAIWVEYNAETGKADVYIKFRPGFIKPGQYANGHDAAWFENKIIDIINAKLANSDWNNALIKQETQDGGQPEDGKYRSDEMNFLQWAGFAGDQLGYIVNEAELKGSLWNDIDDADSYQKSAMNIWAPVAAGGDQALQQVKDIYALVEFAGNCISDPGTIKNVYKSVTSITFDQIQYIIAEQIKQKKEQYAKGGTVMQYHTVRDATQVIQMAMSAPMALKNVKGIVTKGGTFLQSFKNLLREIPHMSVKNKVKELSDIMKGKFLEAFDGAENKLKELLKLNEKVYDAWKRVAESGIEGLTLKVKKFPTSKEGENKILELAKKYQAKFSGEADLSFELNGVSFDNFEEGLLIDAKFGHGNSIFNKISDVEWEELPLDDLVKNQSRVQSLIKQAQRQLGAVEGKGLKIQWNVSSELGAKGIQRVFDENNINILVKYVEL